MATIIVCWGVPFLLEMGKKGPVKFIICLFIASSIHMSVWFYAVFLLARKPFTKKQITLIFVMVCFLSLFIAFSSHVGAFTSLFNNEKVDAWLNRSGSDSDMGRLNFGGFLMSASCIIFVVTVVCLQANKLISRYGNKFVTWERNIRLRRVVLYKNIGILILLSIAGLAAGNEFYRYLYGMFPVFYALFAEFWFSKVGVSTNIKRRLTIAAFIAVLWTAQAYIGGMKSHDVFATLTDNMIFK